IKMAASDDEIRVAATPYGIAVTIALHDLSFLAACLRTDIRRSQFDNVGEQLKILHDGVRGLRTELDLRNDSTWGKQLTSIGGDTKARAYRQMQVKAAIRFCEVLFGQDYASLMSRAAENAVTGERKSSERKSTRNG